eukprot:753029-Pyramimonas_sp.AAC.1
MLFNIVTPMRIQGLLHTCMVVFMLLHDDTAYSRTIPENRGSTTKEWRGQSCEEVWAGVRNAIAAHTHHNVTTLVRDLRSDASFSYAKGSSAVSLQQNIPVASASKWVSTALIMKLVSEGFLALTDRPQQYLPFWAASDARGNITLSQVECDNI